MINVCVCSTEKFEEYVKNKECIRFWKSEIDLLHPDDRFEKAEFILDNHGRLKRDVFINTYSDKFVESMEVLSSAKDIPVKFYYSDELIEVIGLEIVRLYDYLGDVYDKINKIRGTNLVEGK